LSEDFIAINDNMKRFAMGFYAKHNGGERELDSRETERECVHEKEAEHKRKREAVLVQRSTDLHKHEKEMKSDKQDKLCQYFYNC